MMKWDDDQRGNDQYQQLKGELRERLEDHGDLSREQKRLALEVLVDELVMTDTERDEMVERAARYLASAAHSIGRTNDSRQWRDAANAYLKVSTWLQQHKDEIHLP